MRLTPSLLFTTLAVTLLAGSVLPSKSPASAAPDEIARLDACIQRRFLDTTSFGMSRVLTVDYHRTGRFVTENEAERSVIGQLMDQHYDVGFFLLGRLALTTAISPRFIAPKRIGVQGPAYITALRAGDLPKTESLIEEARAALLSFDTGEGYNVQHGDWTVAMRPLRAATERCVQCHTANTGAANLKIGDALGVAMYVYRR